MVGAAFGTVFGGKIGALIIAVSISLFALSTVLSWSLYGSRCVEYLFGSKSMRVYQVVFIVVVALGSFVELDVAWTLAEALNGFMAIPNLIALLALSPVVVKLTKEYFAKNKLSGKR